QTRNFYTITYFFLLFVGTPANQKGRGLLRLKMRFHGSEFSWLSLCYTLGRMIAAKGL
ncbi:MAG: hypothetical protein JWQ28_1215, partial [Pedobacter sp.]|nr:hypothetical protein [Pedobacter sp.]